MKYALPCVLVFAATAAFAQEKTESKRMFGILPNYKTTSEDASTAVPLTNKQKFKLAAQNSFDPGALFTTGIVAGFAHWKQQYPSFGGGMQGYGKRYGLMYTDTVSSNFLTEAIVPIALHQDPRYFRRGHGSVVSRVGYSVSRLALIRTKDGHLQPNGPELLGSFSAASLANLYYPSAERSASNTAFRFSSAVLSDGFSNLMREFWPDISKKMHKHKSTTP